MLLDSGIVTFFKNVDTAEPGHMPALVPVVKHKSWYGQLDFVTSPRWATEARKDINVSMKIRVHQNTTLTEHDTAVLADVDTPEGQTVFDVVRIFHTVDNQSGEPVSDVSLEVLEP